MIELNPQVLELTLGIEKGDCGSWVLDPTNGNWLGHIVAGRSGTTVGYIVLARDIVKDITNQLGVQTVKISSETEMDVTEAVKEIKRDILFAEPTTPQQGYSSKMFTAPSEATELAEVTSLQGSSLPVPGKLVQIFSFSVYMKSVHCLFISLRKREQVICRRPRWVRSF